MDLKKGSRRLAGGVKSLQALTAESPLAVVSFARVLSFPTL
ncbi:hypothetical protein [uncultured Paenibacillus sp.]|nr:hypothetical protein [uncultured Paenibacillus sp.]